MHARLLIGGISCAACTWLIEQVLQSIQGVIDARVNLQQARLDVSFDARILSMSDIFARLDSLGYRPRPFAQQARREHLQAEYRDDLRRLAVAGIGMMQVGMFAIALHAGEIQGMEPQYAGLLRWVSLPVAAVVVLYSARSFFSTAWRHLRHGKLVMDLPVALAIGLAFIASIWATITQSGQVYFDSVVMFTFFLLLGRFLEKRARRKHTEAWLDAEDELPGAVSVRNGEHWETVPRIRLRQGDTVLIRIGETVPVDARIVLGQSAVREDSFNGEHLPRSVGEGDTVYAGTLNVEGNLQAIALGTYRDTRLAALRRSVDIGGGEKPRLARFADAVAAWFVAGILLAASVTALVWLQIDPERALWVTLSVLVISCPCALALATPAALASAASALRGMGVLVRGEDALETLPRCTHLLFDKTGTLTLGQLRIAQVLPLARHSEAQILSLGAALQRHASHPVASAFGEYTRDSEGFDAVSYVVGAGLMAQRGAVSYRMGSIAFCREIAPALPDPPDDDRLWVALCREGEPLAWIGLDDPLRGDAGAVVAAMRDTFGLHLELLTGDSSARAPRLAAALGMDIPGHGLSPEDKMARVRALQHSGARVCMVGDGLNDAPVLALADVSFAVAGATDLARTQADFVITDGGLQRLLDTCRVAQRCRRVVRQNLGWALTYNLTAIPIAAAGLIPPWVAALGMSLSSLLVVMNSLRLNSPGRPIAGGPMWKVSTS
ncbi:MAG: cation-translocating P-type ATPase [Halioglobus sp.]